MDIKNIRSSFLLTLLLALIVFTAGMTYILVDIQRRLGSIEHYIMHHIYGGGLESSGGAIDEPWQKYQK